MGSHLGNESGWTRAGVYCHPQTIFIQAYTTSLSSATVATKDQTDPPPPPRFCCATAQGLLQSARVIRMPALLPSIHFARNVMLAAVLPATAATLGCMDPPARNVTAEHTVPAMRGTTETSSEQRPQVVVVGAGISGVSAAYHLRKSMPHKRICIL